MGITLAAWLMVPLPPPPQTAVIEIDAGRYDRSGSLVEVKLPDGFGNGFPARLVRQSDGKVLAAQIVRGKLVWVLDQPLKAGTKRRYALSAPKSPYAPPVALCKADASGDLLIRIGKKRVLRHNVSVKKSKTLPIAQSRSGHIHPLYAPNGEMVTDDFSHDHPHQRGVYFAWTKTKFRGKNIDFWNLHRNNGRTEHRKTLGTFSGIVAAGYSTGSQSVAASFPKDGTAVLLDRWDVRCVQVPDGFLLDVTSTQSCLTSDPLILPKYHYGGFAIRGNRAWGKPDDNNRFAMITSEGKRRRPGNHTRPKWVEFGGTVKGKPTGVTIFGHPKNFRYPQPVRLHPGMPYFCFPPMVTGEFQIKPGTKYVSRYRLLVHARPADAKRSTRLWNDYANPIAARIVK